MAIAPPSVSLHCANEPLPRKSVTSKGAEDLNRVKGIRNVRRTHRRITPPNFVGPVLAPVRIRRLDLPAQHQSCDLPRDIDRPIQQHIRKQSRNQAIRYTVAERHTHNRHERGQRIPDIRPIHTRDLPDHHAPHENQRTARSPRRNRRKDGSKEERDEETETRGNSREAGAATLRDACPGLDERSDG